jgi:hypothetical protein
MKSGRTADDCRPLQIRGWNGVKRSAGLGAAQYRILHGCIPGKAPGWGTTHAGSGGQILTLDHRQSDRHGSAAISRPFRFVTASRIASNGSRPPTATRRQPIANTSGTPTCVAAGRTAVSALSGALLFSAAGLAEGSTHARRRRLNARRTPESAGPGQPGPLSYAIIPSPATGSLDATRSFHLPARTGGQSNKNWYIKGL